MLPGLDAHRRSPEKLTAALIERTTAHTLANATQWSTRTMARGDEHLKASVSRIWRANGIKPHRVESSSRRTRLLQFADKLEAIVGLDPDPPEHASALSVDEKSPDSSSGLHPAWAADEEGPGAQP